jgi:hypothetical protein
MLTTSASCHDKKLLEATVPFRYHLVMMEIITKKTCFEIQPSVRFRHDVIMTKLSLKLLYLFVIMTKLLDSDEPLAFRHELSIAVMTKFQI